MDRGQADTGGIEAHDGPFRPKLDLRGLHSRQGGNRFPDVRGTTLAVHAGNRNGESLEGLGGCHGSCLSLRRASGRVGRGGAIEVRDTLGKERGNVGIGECVVGDAPFLAETHNAERAQESQVL